MCIMKLLFVLNKENAMAKVKKSNAPGEKTKNSINISRFQRELDAIRKKNEDEGYKPKFGRQIKALKKKMNKIS